MEEVDNIIIHSLRQIGCDIDETITSLSSFTAELVVGAVVKCLKIIKPSLEMPTELSQNMAARHRIGSSLAQELQDLGYGGTIGYQIFLYPSDSELRRLFPFLIEKFPKEDKPEDSHLKEASWLEKSVAGALSVSLSEPWLPHYCHRPETKFKGYTKVPYSSVRLNAPSRLKKDEDYEDYYKSYLTPVQEQIKSKDELLPSVLSYNSQLLYSLPTNIIDRLDWINSQHQTESVAINLPESSHLIEEINSQSEQIVLQKEPELKSPIKSQPENEKPIKREHSLETEIEKVSDECEELKLSIVKEQGEMEKLNAKLSQIRLVQQSEQQELSVLEEQKKMIARSYDLLGDGETNIEKLEKVIETKRCKMINLATEWEETRKPLIDKYRDQKENNSNKAKMNEIRLLRDKERELSQELKNKEQQYIQLANEIQKVSKDTNRSAYTQRILEIINNIRKQKDEIEKVIEDTRMIKKDINILSGRLDRSYAVAEETCRFETANRLLKTLHSKFSSLIDSVEKTGATVREIRDLEEQVNSELEKNVEANLERITADLEQMKRESEALKAQLQCKLNAISGKRKTSLPSEHDEQ